MTHDQRSSLIEFIDRALSRGVNIHVSAFPRTIPDVAALYSAAEEITDPVAGGAPEEGYHWWRINVPGVGITLHGTDGTHGADPEPVADRTQVDRTTPYEAPVTVATTPHSRYGTDAGIE